VLSSRSPAIVWNPAKPKPPDWRKQLGEVFPPRDCAAWPSQLEILYVVDVAKNIRCRHKASSYGNKFDEASV
jgi:hypothetical protein